MIPFSSSDEADNLRGQDVVAAENATTQAEKRGLVVSFVTLLLSIPALIGA